MTAGPVDESKAPADKHPLEPLPGNVDRNYESAYRNHLRQTHASSPFLVNLRADNQYIWVYAQSSFLRGAAYGSAIGVASAIYYRRLRLIPQYAVGFGVAYAALHASSAYFRNEI